MEIIQNKLKNQNIHSIIYKKQFNDRPESIQQRISAIPFTKENIYPSQIKPFEPFGALRSFNKIEKDKERQIVKGSKTQSSNVFKEKLTLEDIKCKPAISIKLDLDKVYQTSNFQNLRSLSTRYDSRSSISHRLNKETVFKSQLNNDYVQYKRNKQIEQQIHSSKTLIQNIAQEIEKKQATPQANTHRRFQSEQQLEKNFIQELEERKIQQKLEALLPQPSNNLKISSSIEERLRIFQQQNSNNLDIIKDLEFNPETDLEYEDESKTQDNGKKNKNLKKIFYGFKEKKALLQVKNLFDNDQ